MWLGFSTQVRERYLAGKLTQDELGRDLAIAGLLDEGILTPDAVVPTYLVDRNGFPLAFTSAGLTPDGELLLAESA